MCLSTYGDLNGRGLPNARVVIQFTIKPWQDEITHWEREKFPLTKKLEAAAVHKGDYLSPSILSFSTYMLKPLLKTPIYQGDRISQGFLLWAMLPRADSNKSAEAQGPPPLTAFYLHKQILEISLDRPDQLILNFLIIRSWKVSWGGGGECTPTSVYKLQFGQFILIKK